MEELLENKLGWYDENFDKMWDEAVEFSNQQRREFMYPVKMIYSIGSVLGTLIGYLF